MRYTQTPTPSITATPSLTPSNTPTYTPTSSVCPGLTPTPTNCNACSSYTLYGGSGRGGYTDFEFIICGESEPVVVRLSRTDTPPENELTVCVNCLSGVQIIAGTGSFILIGDCSPTPTPTKTPTNTPTPTLTPGLSPSPTRTPTETPTNTPSPSNNLPCYEWSLVPPEYENGFSFVDYLDCEGVLTKITAIYSSGVQTFCARTIVDSYLDAGSSLTNTFVEC